MAPAGAGGSGIGREPGSSTPSAAICGPCPGSARIRPPNASTSTRTVRSSACIRPISGQQPQSRRAIVRWFAGSHQRQDQGARDDTLHGKHYHLPLQAVPGPGGGSIHDRPHREADHRDPLPRFRAGTAHGVGSGHRSGATPRVRRGGAGRHRRIVDLGLDPVRATSARPSIRLRPHPVGRRFDPAPARRGRRRRQGT